MRGAWCESVAEAVASPQTRRALSPPLIHSAGTHQGAYATRDFHWACSIGSALPSSRRELLRYPATRRWWSLLRVPCAFSLPPQSIGPNKRAYPRVSLSASPYRPFSFFLLVRLSSPLTRAFFIARCLVVACPLVNFAPATMPRGGRETRRQQPLPPPLSLSSPSPLTPPSSSHPSSSSYLPLPSDAAAAAASYRRCCHDLLCSR